MKNSLKIAVLVAFVAAGVIGLGATGASVHGEGALAVGSPRSLYVQNCARCHGVNGKAQTRLGRRLEAADLTSSDVKELSTQRIVRVITRGRLEMPAFGKKLTAGQIASIAQYVRSL